MSASLRSLFAHRRKPARERIYHDFVSVGGRHLQIGDRSLVAISERARSTDGGNPTLYPARRQLRTTHRRRFIVHGDLIATALSSAWSAYIFPSIACIFHASVL